MFGEALADKARLGGLTKHPEVGDRKLLVLV